MSDPLKHLATTEPESLAVLAALVYALKPRRILEIGTAFGIGTLTLHDAADPTAIIHTIEKDHEMILASRTRLKPFPNVFQYEADSAVWIPHVVYGAYDFVYVDGGEDRRAADLEKFYRYTLAGGLILVHDMRENNALYWQVLDVVARLRLVSYRIGTAGGLLLVRA